MKIGKKEEYGKRGSEERGSEEIQKDEGEEQGGDTGTRKRG